MIRFISLTMKNFLSYPATPTIVQLEQPGTTLIIGEDLDNTSNGQGANGCGKTTIVNAITYALYDKPVSNISKDNLVNNINKKNMEVIVEFVANNGKTYRVRRTRKMKAGATGNTVQLFENGEDITLDSVSNTNNKLVEILGIPYELFVRIVVFTASHTPFLDLPAKSHYAANQTDIIEELFGLTALSQKAEILKTLIKDMETGLEMQKVRLSALEKEHVRHQQQLISAKMRVDGWREQNNILIKQLKEKLTKVEKVDVDEQRSYYDVLATLNENLSTILDKKRIVEHTLQTRVEELKKNEKDLSHLRDEKCPYCLQQFANAHKKIKEHEKLSETYMDEITKLKKEIDSLNAKVPTLSHQIKEIRTKLVVDNVEELIDIRNESANIKAKIEELQKATNPFIEPLKELQAVKLDNLDYEEINKKTKELNHQRFLLKLLTKKDSFVRKALLNKNIPYLNARLQYYLTFLGLQHKVVFTHEMTAAISQFGHPLDFGNLSAGQKARVNIALSFAFRDVLQSLHTKINICMLDEVLDVGLDAVGVQSAARLLKRKARDEKISLYVISHRDEIDGVFDRTMTVQMSKGFSYIKQDETESE